MIMNLISITLDAFKGIDHLTLDMEGCSAALYGANGLGKTSVYDGWLWLITGKDSAGRVPDDTKGFQIKPLDSAGNVANNAQHSTVSAVVELDGQRHTLRKEYYEKWTRKRGATDAEYDGNTTDYYIDEVPRSKREYESWIGGYVPLDVFALLSYTDAFARLDAGKRRSILFDLAEIGDDAAIMAQDSRFEPLQAATGTITLEEYQRQLTARRKNWNRERTDLPARIDEVHRTTDKLRDIPFDKLRESVADMERERDSVSAQLRETAQDVQRDLFNDQRETENALSALEVENKDHRLGQQQNSPNLQGAKTELNRLETGFRYESERYHLAQRDVERCENETAKHRDKWKEKNRETYPGEAICPTCGQPLPPEKQAEAKKAWEIHHQRELDRIAEEGKRYKQAAEKFQTQVSQIQDRMVALENDIAQQRDIVAAMEAAPKQEITDLPDYESRKAELTTKLEHIKKQLEDAKQDEWQRKRPLMDNLTTIERELAALRGELAKEATLTMAVNREAELREQLRSISQQMEQTDKMLDLIDQFTRFKAEFVTDSINAKFQLARFRLFRQQVNGGLMACCDVMCQGVPYDQGLNTGARVQVGLDMIATLSRHYGVEVPVFVDGAESVTDLISQPGSQMIRLVVSEKDRKLRFEV